MTTLDTMILDYIAIGNDDNIGCVARILGHFRGGG